MQCWLSFITLPKATILLLAVNQKKRGVVQYQVHVIGTPAPGRQTGAIYTSTLAFRHTHTRTHTRTCAHTHTHTHTGAKFKVQTDPTGRRESIMLALSPIVL